MLNNTSQSINSESGRTVRVSEEPGYKIKIDQIIVRKKNFDKRQVESSRGGSASSYCSYYDHTPPMMSSLPIDTSLD